MTQRLRRRGLLLLSSAVLLTWAAGVRTDHQPADRASQDAPPAKQGEVNPDAQILLDFKTRLDEYAKLRARLQKEGPPLEETPNPGEILTAQKTLAEKIRAARKNAQRGDIFTPEVQKLFHRLMYPELKGPVAAETKEAMKEDAPKSVPLKVNAAYPEGAPLPTVPPNLLAALPKLPEDLEYRFVNRDLILRDVHSNLIVDFFPNAIK